ncbi:MAG: glycosyltransferase family 4 protein, partial [Gemmatimonadetes bacterium]|nr:glycosyltransferase family 4 protein [Gemmatimonadota bacterium]NIR81473.1 glycosyltransferase family 4 protein [Gemmatimonadota bacterium]NIT90322.1 glycosyltransferase family 4 protein [Gemmatimonadota bacterium]NIU34142.1 glycosyltransferase family 4 protein [Gemmatimonadota bacterium]NIU38296.1 glycosyltransferase family 4 protein [Gemmatimonadota bacterium]
ETAPAWQLRWLEEELTAGEARHTFLFTGRPILRPEEEPVLAREDDYLGPPSFRRGLLELVDRHGVDAVFAANLPVFDHQVREGTQYVTTGGAGGLVVGDETSFHHFVTAEVTEDGVSIEARRLDVGQHPVFRTLESLWLFVHSLFFVGYLNFLLILSVLVLVAVELYGLVFVERDYYPSFDLDPEPYIDAPLRVAMFTNNYLPFIGGVPLSIERLRTGLKALGKEVLVVAPRYDEEEGKEDPDGGGIFRVPSILSFGKEDEFRLANIFLPRI